MDYRKVTAIVRTIMLEFIERELMSMNISGISITQVSGYGEYHNFYKPDMMCTHARIEIFCRADQAENIAQSIMNVAHLGQPGDGIVAILPVEQLYRIRTKEPEKDHGRKHHE